MRAAWGIITLQAGGYPVLGFVSLFLFLFQEMREHASSDATYTCNQLKHNTLGHVPSFIQPFR